MLALSYGVCPLRLVVAGGVNKVELNTAVTEINVGKTAVNLLMSNGTALAADWVILTVPPSCWEQMMGTPAIYNCSIQMGDCLKWLVNVKRRFWLKHNVAPSMSADDMGIIWEGTDNQNLPSNRPAELSIFVGGSQYSRNPISQQMILKQLDGYYLDFNKNFQTVECVDWPGDKWAGAGYCCPGIGEVTTFAKTLFDGHGPLKYAGEHTCMPFFGYMEGAIYSGLRVARSIAKHEGIVI